MINTTIHNLEFPANQTGFKAWMMATDNLSEGYFGWGVPLVIFFIIFLALVQRNEPKHAFWTASIANAVITIIFAAIVPISAWQLAVLIGVPLAIGTLWIFLTSD